MNASIQPGTLLGGDFRIESELGAGGFGTVFRAMQISTGRARAVKVLHARLETDPDSRRRFLEEARIGARVKSGHIVEVVASGFDEAARAPWLAMELLEGENMHERVRNGGPIAIGDARGIFEQLAHGLGAAHDQGIVHRDLKPENIFLCRPRHHGGTMMVKILDFGIAKSIEDGRTAGTATAAIGSPLFMAPEQGTEGAAIRPATDVWPLGLIAFFALTGLDYWKAAHGSRNLQAMFTEVLVEPIEPATERARRLGATVALPPRFDAWFAACLERDPTRRFRNARACLRALDGLLADAAHAPAAYAATVAAPVTPAPVTPTPVTPAPVVPTPTPTAELSRRAPVAPTAPMALQAAPPAPTAPLGLAPTSHVEPPGAPPAPPPRASRGLLTGPTVLVALMAFGGAAALTLSLFGDRLTGESSVEAPDVEPEAVEPVVPAPSQPPPEPTPVAPTPQPQPVPRQPAVDLGLPTPESATATPEWQMHTRIYEFPAARHARRVVPIRFRVYDGARAEIFVNGRSHGNAPVEVRVGPGLHLIGQVDESGTAEYGWVVLRAFGPWQELSVEPQPEHNFIHPRPGRSHLFLQTDLPLRVSVDGRVVDFEAEPAMDVAPGRHVMVMRNTETGREERLEVRCAANRTTSVRRSRRNLDVYLQEL